MFGASCLRNRGLRILSEFCAFDWLKVTIVKGRIYPEKDRPIDRICLLTESSSNSENVILVSVFDMQQVSCSKERTQASGEF